MSWNGSQNAGQPAGRAGAPRPPRKKSLFHATTTTPNYNSPSPHHSSTPNYNNKRSKPQGNGELVAFSQDGMPSLEVWLEDETIWLTQKQMAELFGCAVENVIHHIANIYKEEELEETATTKDYLVVRLEGKRQVTRKVRHYNLDLIISVGYRINSKRGVKFRIWATSVLKEYLLRGSVRDQRITKLEKRMTCAERSIDTLIYALTPTLPEKRTRIGFHP